LILTIDTFAWVEMMRGTALGNRARQAMKACDTCVTPSIVLAEVASKCRRFGLADALIRDELYAIHEASTIVSIDDAIATAAAHATKELRQGARSSKLGAPGLADGLVLATARVLGAKLLTGDPHFRACEETHWLA
jgi:predicted nucleic acid-binding protein